MEAEAFRTAAREMIDYVIDYLEGIRDRRVLPTVEPGYMQGMLPAEAPREPEPWSAVLSDIERVIMPGVRGRGGGSSCHFLCIHPLIFIRSGDALAFAEFSRILPNG